jgi:hypothetical protein
MQKPCDIYKVLELQRWLFMSIKDCAYPIDVQAPKPKKFHTAARRPEASRQNDASTLQKLWFHC